MSDKESASVTTSVTVEMLTTIDLGPEIDGMARRQLRMRKVTIAPGGVFGPIHDHKDRPGTVIILQRHDYRSSERHCDRVRARCGLARGQEYPALA